MTASDKRFTDDWVLSICGADNANLIIFLLCSTSFQNGLGL
jgi:hypothetical protein